MLAVAGCRRLRVRRHVHLGQDRRDQPQHSLVGRDRAEQRRLHQRGPVLPTLAGQDEHCPVRVTDVGHRPVRVLGDDGVGERAEGRRERALQPGLGADQVAEQADGPTGSGAQEP